MTRSPLADAEVLQHAAERRHLVAQLGVGVGARRLGDGAVVDQRLLLAAAALDVPVEAVAGGVALGADEPAAVLARVGVEHLLPGRVPVDLARGLGPERLGVALPGGVDLVIAARHASSRAAVALFRAARGGIVPSGAVNARATLGSGAAGSRRGGDPAAVRPPARGRPRPSGRGRPRRRCPGRRRVARAARRGCTRCRPRRPGTIHL